MILIASSLKRIQFHFNQRIWCWLYFSLSFSLLLFVLCYFAILFDAISSVVHSTQQWINQWVFVAWFLRTCTRIKSIHQIRWTSERAKKCLYLFFLSFFSWMLAQHDSHRKKNRWRKKFNNIKYRYIYCLCQKREKQRRERIRSTQFVIARCQFPQGNRFRCMMIMFHHVPHSLHIIFVCICWRISFDHNSFDVAISFNFSVDRNKKRKNTPYMYGRYTQVTSKHW